MELKLVQVKDDVFKLCNENGEKIVNFDVEFNKDTALISYDTEEQFRHKGMASYGLELLKNVLFNDNKILFLELINLTGDYSRKVAENAGFISRYNTLDYYIALNPQALEIVNERSSISESSTMDKTTQRLINKINSLKRAEEKTYEGYQNKLEQLLCNRENIEPSEYKDYVESEIHHLEKILSSHQENIKKR